jgi:hypothetical protein
MCVQWWIGWNIKQGRHYNVIEEMFMLLLIQRWAELISRHSPHNLNAAESSLLDSAWWFFRDFWSNFHVQRAVHLGSRLSLNFQYYNVALICLYHSSLSSVEYNSSGKDQMAQTGTLKSDEEITLLERKMTPFFTHNMTWKACILWAW